MGWGMENHQAELVTDCVSPSAVTSWGVKWPKLRLNVALCRQHLLLMLQPGLPSPFHRVHLRAGFVVLREGPEEFCTLHEPRKAAGS